jgi:hypothetical protein
MKCHRCPKVATLHITELVKGEVTLTVGLAPSDLEPVLARTAAAMPQVAELFDLKLGTPEEISGVLDQATETLVAFANTEGGTLLFGLREDGEVAPKALEGLKLLSTLAAGRGAGAGE